MTDRIRSAYKMLVKADIEAQIECEKHRPGSVSRYQADRIFNEQQKHFEAIFEQLDGLLAMANN